MVLGVMRGNCLGGFREGQDLANAFLSCWRILGLLLLEDLREHWLAAVFARGGPAAIDAAFS